MVQSLCLLQRWVTPCLQRGTAQQGVREDRHLRHPKVRQQLNDAWQDWKVFQTEGIVSHIRTPSWAWLSFEPAHGCGSSWKRAPLLPLLCYSPIVLQECAGNNYADKLNIISIIKSVWWFVSIYELVGIRSHFFFSPKSGFTGSIGEWQEPKFALPSDLLSLLSTYFGKT